MNRKKIYWIVGASSGIGAALVNHLAEAGNFVICSARSEDKLHALEKQHPYNVKSFVWDVNSEDLSNISTALENETDVIDVMIYCAGICEYDDALQFEQSMYRRVMDTNFMGLINAVKIALPYLSRSKGSPRIVGISSLASRLPFPRAGVYGASKAAMEYFLQSLKVELKDKNIGVSIVRPGFVDTPMARKNDFPMPFIMSSPEAVDHILNGLNRKKLFIDFPVKLSWPLTLAKWVPSIWLNNIAPKFRKIETL